MSIEEQRRLIRKNEHQEVAQRFFEMLTNYFKNESLLNADDIYRREDNTIRLMYDNRQYLLEATFNENIFKGQLVVYKARNGEEFNPEPNFEKKENSLIFFDKQGNIFIGQHHVGHNYPANSAEDLINEIKKNNLYK